MKHDRGSAALWIIVVVFAILIAAGAYYLLYQTNSAPQPAQNVSESSTTTTAVPSQDQSLQQKPTVSPATDVENSGSLTATPSSGAAPFAVTFSGTLSTSIPSSEGGLGLDESSIDFGDEQEGDLPSVGEVGCNNTPYNTTGYVYPTSCAFAPVSHTYTLPGTYTVVLNLGNQRPPYITLATTTITVTGSGPVFQKSLVSPDGLTAPASGTPGQPVTFSTSYGGQDTGAAYFVDFGNNTGEWFLCGQTTDGYTNDSCLPPTFQHTYSGSGTATYTVILHKYTGDDKSSPAVGMATVTISGTDTLPPPTCTLTASPSTAAVGQPIMISWATQNTNTNAEGPAGYGAWVGGVGSGDLFESSEVLTQMKTPTASSGSQTIQLDKTGTDTLTLEINGPGAGGEGQCSVLITVR